MLDERHDVIIVGAGVAGSRLLAHLLASAWQARRILVIEREPPGRRDHLLAFWGPVGPGLDRLIEHRWRAVRVIDGEGGEQVHLVEEPYVATHRGRVTEIVAQQVAAGRLQFLAGEVAALVDGAAEAAVRVGDRWYRAAWVFDGRPAPPGPATVRLVQRFTGWIVESTELRQDPAIATLFDFRTPQAAGLAFVYVLPFAPGRTLVEHVFTGPADAVPPAPADALGEYLHIRLGLRAGSYTVVSREQGNSWLSDARHPRRGGRRICTIGTRGGRLKPSSGYALTRIEADSAAIVRSLTHHGHPFRLPRERRIYRWLDAIFLGVLAREPGRAPRIFAALMRRPADTLRFLDERPRLPDLLRLLMVLPTLLFLRAAWRWLWTRRRPQGGEATSRTTSHPPARRRAARGK
jgi:lycopene beta-cyclase